MKHTGRLVLILGVLLCLGAQLSLCQHWSHGWYPGGKRDLDSLTTAEVLEELNLCDGGDCSYPRPQRKSLLKNILLDALTREFQRKRK